MGPTRERSSRPTRRLLGRRPYRPRQTDYSHISIRERDESAEMTDLTPAAFVARPSLQDTIAEDLAYAKRIASTTSCDESPPGSHPLTFAEAAMSTRVRGTISGSSSKKDPEQRDSMIGSRKFEILGVLRPLKKRKKPQKWAALDLSAVADDASEASNSYSSAPQSPALSATFNPTPSGAVETPPLLPFPDIDAEAVVTQSNVYTGIEDRFVSEESYLSHAADEESISTHNLVEAASAENQDTLEVAFIESQHTLDPSSTDNQDSIKTSSAEHRSTLQAPVSSTKNRSNVDAASTDSRITLEAPSVPTNLNGEFTFRSTPLDAAPKAFKDTVETKKNFEVIMAHLSQYTIPPVPAPGQENNPGQDAFDSITWDPDLPRGSSPADKSPEKLAPKPKPVVAYTTVGSVVNPNNVPQFSAPNRIQREGAGRRPLMSMTNRQYDNLFQTHVAPSPHLGMQNSMQYTQHLQLIPSTYDELRPRLVAPPNQLPSAYGELRPQSVGPASQLSSTYEELGPRSVVLPSQELPSTFEDLRPRSAAPAPTNQLPSTINLLTDQEKQVLAKLDEAILKIPLNIRKTTTVSATSSVSGSTPAFRPRILLNDEDANRAYNVQGQRQGLEKMQTLQRLARFENPMREHALSRLSEFSVSAQAATKTNAVVPGPFEAMSRSQSQSTEGASRGEFNTGYQFPPPGFPSMANPLYGAYSSSTYNSAPPSRPPGYPQPLTAGPPGQRQANQAFFNARNAAMGVAEGGNANVSRQPSGFTSYGTPNFQNTTGIPAAASETPMQTENAYPPSRFTRENNTWYPNNDPFRQSPWPYTTQQQQLVETGQLHAPSVDPLSLGPHTLLIDTIPNEMMAKYYPNGPPSGLGYYRVAGPKVETSFRAVEQEHLPEHEGRGFHKIRKQKELDDWFYSGVHRMDMTGEDHIVEHEHQGGVIPPSKPQTRPFLTPEEIEKMSVSDCAKPMVNGAFGSLLGYAVAGDNSRKTWSRFAPAAPEIIDESSEGNKSCFGEDWGRSRPS